MVPAEIALVPAGVRPAALDLVVRVGSCLVVPVRVGPETPALAIQAGPVTSDRVVRATIGGHRGIRRTTIGEGGSMVPRGERACRRGAGARLLVLPGTGYCRSRGVLRHRRSTTSATRSSRCGIRASINGDSGFSGFGFRSPFDKQASCLVHHERDDVVRAVPLSPKVNRHGR